MASTTAIRTESGEVTGDCSQVMATMLRAWLPIYNVREEGQVGPSWASFLQEYGRFIPKGAEPICMPPVAGDFAMPPNYLHIWPRGQFMMIGIVQQADLFLNSHLNHF